MNEQSLLAGIPSCRSAISSNQGIGKPGWLRNDLKSLFVCFLSTGLLFLTQPVVADYLFLDDSCINDNYNAFNVTQELTCTANDVRVTEAIAVEIIDPCEYPGDTLVYQGQFEVLLTAQARHDVAVYLSQDGGDALFGSCGIFTLPYSADAFNQLFTDLDGTNDDTRSGDLFGYCADGGFLVVDANTGYPVPCAENTQCGAGETCQEFGSYFGSPVQDTCGDIDENLNPIMAHITEHDIELVCIDDDGDGLVDLNWCTSWRLPGDNDLCLSPRAAFPGAPTRCNCNQTNLFGVPVPKTIEVIKRVEPSTAVGVFDLEIDGTVYQANAGDGGTTGRVVVEPGVHSVGERGGDAPATTLSDYSSDISCIDKVGRCTSDSSIHCITDRVCSAITDGASCDLSPTEVASCADCTTLNVDVPWQQSDIVCEITNTLTSIALSKTGDTLSKVGDEVNYTITLANTSSVEAPDLGCTVTDQALGINNSVTLASGASHVISAAYTVSQQDPDPLVNTASATCSPIGSPNVLEAAATHTINLFQPSIYLEKIGNELSKVGDEVIYTITLVNTSSADTPDLECTVTDLLLGIDKLVTLASGESDLTIVSYTVPVDASDPLTNHASASCSPVGFPNVLDAEAQWDVDLLHPQLEVALACGNEPVPQVGPAEFLATFINSGDADLDLSANLGIGSFSLAQGQTQSYPVSLPESYSGQPTVSAMLNATATLAAQYGLPNILSGSATEQCAVASQLAVIKTTNGVEDPGRDWLFSLWQGPDGFDGILLASDTTFNDSDGILGFANLSLDGAGSYTVCEEGVPAGYATFWRVDANGDGFADTTVVPYNPDADANPPADYGNRCTDFGMDTDIDLLRAGGTLVFEVDNAAPGGAPRSPGYWKNWNRCTNGGQADRADANGGWAEGFWLLEDVLDPSIGGGIVWDDILSDGFEFPISTCEEAVAILDARDVSGKKKSRDGAYTLARALLAAQLNFGAGACTTPEVLDAVLEAETLLDEVDFDGSGDYLRPRGGASVPYWYALGLASDLDQYNNGAYCGDTD